MVTYKVGRIYETSKFSELTDPCLVLEIMMSTYTNLSTYEQGLLKCAAILGVFFTRHMLQSMMHNFSNFHTTRGELKIEKTIIVLDNFNELS